jgi:hypothetical protein
VKKGGCSLRGWVLCEYRDGSSDGLIIVYTHCGIGSACQLQEGVLKYSYKHFGGKSL